MGPFPKENLHDSGFISDMSSCSSYESSIDLADEDMPCAMDEIR